MRVYENGIYRDETEEERAEREGTVVVGTPTIEDRLSTLEKQLISTTVIKSINLPAANWTGDTNLFSQEVTIDGITANSKIDLQPTPEQFLELQTANITLMVSNNNGTATAYAMNFKPANDYEMQVLITEVTSI